MGLYGERLPDFPWDSLIPYRKRANESAIEQGVDVVDLSVGTPVDPTPDLIQEALKAAANAPGYPTAAGRLELREAISAWYERRRGVPGLAPDEVLPIAGTKEVIALLPAMLGLGTGDVVIIPEIGYPTYEVSAVLAGATPIALDLPRELDQVPETTRLIWLNSPSNPTGAVLTIEEITRVVAWAREREITVASDECYAELTWEKPWTDSAPSVLNPQVNDGSSKGLLSVYSLSKQSNLAGYRAGFVAGDMSIIRSLLEIRRHAGLMVPLPIQAAMMAALRDDTHVNEQRERYRRRRNWLLEAFHQSGLVVDRSEAGLYLWVRAESLPATRLRSASDACWSLIEGLSKMGIVVAPGTFYGALGGDHVRVALTASDDHVQQAASRLRDA